MSKNRTRRLAAVSTAVAAAAAVALVATGGASRGGHLAADGVSMGRSPVHTVTRVASDDGVSMGFPSDSAGSAVRALGVSMG